MFLINDTKSSIKIDCAKECPCGVPVIPVPDQWLEVMVTGGFKVWHIIFIIIAFIVTIIVVYCCFHRCRIPRTKQEIEADLMRTNITNKFRDYLQNFPNEPTTFIEALKKVQELEEKSELDDAQFARDAGARKRMGWLKLKGKGAEKASGDLSKTGTTDATADPDLPSTVATADLNNNTTLASPTTELLTVKSHKLPAQKSQQANEPEQQTKVSLVDPKVSYIQTLPKAIEASMAQDEQLLVVSPAETGEPGGSEAKSVATRQPRRRKQKPNLSRTKRAKELDLDKPIEGAGNEHNNHRDHENSNNNSPRQHVHKVRIERKITTDRNT